MKTYNKLVRDKIPEIIKARGRECDTLIVSGDEKLLEYILCFKIAVHQVEEVRQNYQATL